MTNVLPLVRPDWPAPTNIHALVTKRAGGVSLSPYESFNLATHVGDDPSAIAINRAKLREMMKLPAEPVWLKQVHGIHVVDAAIERGEVEADGAFSAKPGVVCTVLTADCLPVLLCDRAGTCVAALHAGWRGLAAGILEQGVRSMGVPGRDLLAWLGPAIGPKKFEVGEEVRSAFVAQDPEAARAFRSQTPGKYLADIYLLARQRLALQGVTMVFGGDFCTVSDADNFFSYRRDGVTGRMAALIWLDR